MPFAFYLQSMVIFFFMSSLVFLGEQGIKVLLEEVPLDMSFSPQRAFTSPILSLVSFSNLAWTPRMAISKSSFQSFTIEFLAAYNFLLPHLSPITCYRLKWIHVSEITNLYFQALGSWVKYFCQILWKYPSSQSWSQQILVLKQSGTTDTTLCIHNNFFSFFAPTFFKKHL